MTEDRCAETIEEYRIAMSMQYQVYGQELVYINNWTIAEGWTDQLAAISYYLTNFAAKWPKLIKLI